MADEEKPEQAGAAAEASAQGCPVEMHEGRRCGRAVIGAYPALGGTAVCLMHSRNPSKDKKHFQDEIERIVETAANGIADFTRFVFVGGRGGKRKLAARCLFQHAVFLEDARFARVIFEQQPDFNSVTFSRRAIFIGANFLQGVDFSESLFQGEANFARARFEGTGDFMGTQFSGPVVFRACKFCREALFVGAAFHDRICFLRSTFEGDADFEAVAFSGRLEFMDARFEGEASFKSSGFAGRADFSGVLFMQVAEFADAKFVQASEFFYATFEKGACFREAKFTQAADFIGATFAQAADFREAEFAEASDFTGAIFKRAADFTGATFKEAADFSHTTFTDVAAFGGAVFKQAANFRRTIFREDGGPKPGPVFGLAVFGKPEAVLFYQTYLGQALFHNCDASKFTFSDVRWRHRENGKRLVFEEGADLPANGGAGLHPREGSPDERNYGLIAELYQQLKKNYDDRRDYWTAGDWHYGEMEMKRLASPRRNRVVRWVHRNLGLVAWYKYVSEYGENYVLPALWLLVLLLAFALIYPLAGLTPGATVARTAATSLEQGSAQVGLAEAYAGPGIMTTVGVAFFQRDLAYVPSYPWGRLLSWFQLLLTYTLVALFLLALRRQFRR